MLRRLIRTTLAGAGEVPGSCRDDLLPHLAEQVRILAQHGAGGPRQQGFLPIGHACADRRAAESGDRRWDGPRYTGQVRLGNEQFHDVAGLLYR